MMFDSAPSQELRGSDAILLEVQVPELLRRPLGHLHLLDTLDLVELAATEACPKSLARDLTAWVDRTLRQVRDLPNGPSFDEFVTSLEQVPASRVPERVREVVSGEAERRAAPRAAALVATWEGVAVSPFTFGEKRARVQRAEMVTAKKRAVEPSSAPSERSGRGARAPSEGRASAKPSPAVKPSLDIERRRYLEQLCLERLSNVSSKGLAEVVLIAGIRHHAKAAYPDVTGPEVVDALKSLAGSGRARHSAGRWSTSGF